MLPTPLPTELFDLLPPAVQIYLRALEAALHQQSQLILNLQARINQNSSNSSKPPSSNGPHVKPAPPRSPSGRKRGGQHGHIKAECTLLPADEIIDHKPSACPDCGHALGGDDPDPIIDQVIDLPVKLRHVVHHRRHALTCPQCAASTRAAPVAEAASGFGPRLTATTAYLSGVCRLGKRPIQTFMTDVCNIPMAVGSVSKLEAKMSQALEPIHEQAHQHTQGMNANVDETGWKQGGVKCWLWVAVTVFVTVFLIRPKRNRLALKELVGPDPGTLTTDRFSVYSFLIGEKRQVCWAHLRRDFQAMIDRNNAGSEVGRDLLQLSDILFMHWPSVRDGTMSQAAFQTDYGKCLREEVQVNLRAGLACGCVKTAKVCENLLAVEASLWTFATVEQLEPTNNAAERALRHAVCWRKTSYGTNSETGSRFVERILSVVASCRLQKRNVLEFLTQAFLADRGQGSRPSLIPVTP